MQVGTGLGGGRRLAKLPQRWKHPFPLHPMSSFSERKRRQEALNNPPPTRYRHTETWPPTPEPDRGGFLF